MSLLVEATLDSAFTAKARRALAANSGRVMIVTVPEPSYISHAFDYLRTLADGAKIRAQSEKSRSRVITDTDLSDAFAAGQTVVVVTQDASVLDPEVQVAADVLVDVKRPDAAMVRRVINLVTGGRARGLTEQDLARFEVSQIAAAIRPRSTAADCVARLRRIAESSNADDPAAPDLATLPLHGHAKSWARAMVEDITLVHEGRLKAQDIEATILYGSPGTGKTLLAGAVARATGLTFIETSVASWFSGSSGNLDGVLKAAEAFFNSVVATAPSLGFLDEADALPDRASMDPRHAEWWNAVVTGVLLMISKAKASGKPIFFVAATNYLDKIDMALKRPGRFGRHVHIRPAETKDEVAHLFRHYFSDVLNESDVDRLTEIVGTTTPAEVEGWARAARGAARRERRAPNFADVLVQIAPPDSYSDSERRALAVHESAHAVAVLVMGCELNRVSIIASGNTGGTTAWRPTTLTNAISDIEDHAVIALSGRAADEAISGAANTGAVADLQMATTILAAAETTFGLRGRLAVRGEENATRSLLLADSGLLQRVEAALKEQMTRARALVQLYRPAILAVAEALAIKRVLTGSQVEAIVGERMARELSSRASDAASANLETQSIERRAQDCLGEGQTRGLEP